MAFTQSRQPRKQRKARYNAPLHLRQKLVHAHISKDARKKAGVKRKAVAVREGDRVKIMRGRFRGHTGKVSSVNLTSLKVFVEGAVTRKAKGSEVLVAIEPSNLMIMELEMSDKRRKEILERLGERKAAAAPTAAGQKAR